MGQYIQKTYEFTDLVLNTPINLGEQVNGQTISWTLEGNGLSAADSDYQLHESNDGTTWTAVSGAAISNLVDTVAQNATSRNLVSMRYLGFVMVSAGTETTGTLVSRVYAQ